MENLIRQFRQLADMSQVDLASAVDVSRQHIYNLENGKRKPSFDLLVRISNALGCAPSMLLIDPTEVEQTPAYAREAEDLSARENLYLREWRESRDLRPKDIEVLLGISHEKLSEIESGTQAIDDRLLSDFADVYRTNPADLLGRPPTLLANVIQNLSMLDESDLSVVDGLVKLLASRSERKGNVDFGAVRSQIRESS